MLENINFVVRSVGERTEKLCLHALKSQGVLDNDITLLKSMDFNKVQIKSCEVSIEANKTWSVFLDADIVLHPEALVAIERELKENASDRLFRFQPCTLDKFYGGKNPTGPHIYQSKYLEEAVKQVPKTGTLRPESQMVSKITEKLDLINVMSSNACGFHSHEQFYLDLYRTFYFRAQKLNSHYLSFIKKLCWKNMVDDVDSFAAFIGLCVGEANPNKETSLTQKAYGEESISHIKEKEAIKHSDLDEVWQKMFLDFDKYNQTSKISVALENHQSTELSIFQKIKRRLL